MNGAPAVWVGFYVWATRPPAANAHLSDDETVAKTGHPRYGWALCMGHPPEFLLVMNGASGMCVSFHV
jgi:hypothetical protein